MEQQKVQPAAGRAMKQAAKNRPTRPYHVLVIDDEPNMLETLEFILEAADYQVTLARDGKQALDFIQHFQQSSSPIDALITDVRMPVLNGLQLLATLVIHGITIPAIVISEYGSYLMRIQIESRPDSYFVPKPFTEEELLSTLRRILKR